MFIKKVFIGLNTVNCYFVGDKEGEIAIIDPGSDPEKIIDEAKKYDLNIKKIINTHAHFDHIGGNNSLKDKFNTEIHIHEKEKEFLIDPQKNLSSLMGTEVKSYPADKLLRDGDLINIASNEFEVIHTPGHSPGGISLYNNNEKILFSGDTIFKMGIGRADFPTSDKKTLYNSIEEKLLVLPDDVKVYPGHGQKTTIGEFKKIWKQIKS